MCSLSGLFTSGGPSQPVTQQYTANPQTQQLASAAGAGATNLPGPSAVPQQGVAGLTPFQTTGLEKQYQLGMVNPADPFFNMAAYMMGQSGTPVTGNDVGNFYNPMATNITQNLQDIFGQQMKQTTGNAIAGAGGVGADRIGVTQANLAKQQGLAAGQTYAGLYDKALQAALQTKQLQGGAGALYGQLAPTVFGTELGGAQAAAGAGGPYQQTYQNYLNAIYNQQLGQYQNPYQNLAAQQGVLGTMASALGGTQTNTYPQSSPLSGLLGLGQLGVGLYGSGLGSAIGSGLSSMLPMLAMSDRRLKEDISKIGKTKDGQPIYRYRFKGDPTWHTGLIAQDVEKSHPEAVGSIDGMKAIDVKKATDDAVSKQGGGGISALPETTDLGQLTAAMSHGTGTPFKFSDPGKLPDPMGDAEKTMKSFKDLGTGIGNLYKNYQENYADPGSAASPLPGLTAEDYEASGGRVGYQEGGFIDTFDERFRPTTLAERFQPALDKPLTPPDEIVYHDIPEGKNPYGLGEKVDFSNPALEADAGTLPAPARETAAALPGPVGGGAAPSGLPGLPRFERPQPSLAANPWMALIQSGLGTMAASGKRDARGLPLPGVAAIGAGGMEGMKTLEQQREQARKDIAMQNEAEQNLFRAKMAQVPYSQLTKQQQIQSMLPHPIGQNIWGKPVYGVLDPTTGQWKEPGTGKPIDVTQLGEASEEALKPMAKMMANYEMAPLSPFRATTQVGAALTEMIKRENPDYDAKNYGAAQKTLSSFSTGSQGDTVRRFNTFIAHSYTLEAAVKALNNGDIPLFNRLKQKIAEETGQPAPTSFDAIRNIYGNEAVAATVGTRNALGDRQEVRENISRAMSPQQLLDIMEKHRELAGGQVRSLKQQYEAGTKLHNFEDRFLLPESRAALGRVKSYAGREEEPAKAAAPAEAAPKKPPEVGEKRNGYRFKGGDPSKKDNWEKVSG